jgi:hypothetical protein
VTRPEGNALEVLATLRRPEVAEIAAPYIRQFAEAVSVFDVPGHPGLHAVEDREGGMVVEWIFSEARASLMFEGDHSDCGWLFSSRVENGGSHAVGGLDSLDMTALVERTAKAAGVVK